MDISPGSHWASQGIDQTVLQTAKKATDRDHIGNVAERVFDRIVDWFCGTQREEAKKCLYDLFSESIGDESKIARFNTLRDLVGEGYKDFLQIADENGVQTYSLKLDAEDCPDFSLTRQSVPLSGRYILQELQVEAKKDAETKNDAAGKKEDSGSRKQLELDICRADYSVNGEPLGRISPELALEQLGLALAGLNCTEDEADAIQRVCHQGFLAIALNSAAHDEQGHKLDGPVPMTVGPEEVSYDIRRVDGEIHVQARCTKDARATQADSLEALIGVIRSNDALHTSSDLRLDIAIGREGQYRVAESSYVVNKSV